MEGMFYEKLENKKVKCRLCPHNCKISPGKRGICGVRENQDGKLISLNYGKLISSAIDPIEKKPLYHFLPGTKAFSIATVGCNMSCDFCQNFEISQAPKQGRPVVGKDESPAEVVDEALKSGCKSIAYTYTEPTIFFEYAYDCCKLAHENGIKNVFVTNGFTSLEAIDKISKYLDAANIDLKGFTEEYYKKYCGAKLQPVLDSIKRYHENGVFLEITTLIVPGLNEDMLSDIACFIASVDKNIPWHVSRFYPHYKMMDTAPTEFNILKKAVEIGKKTGLKHIYVGNVPSSDDNTYCPKCGKKVIERDGYLCRSVQIENNKCTNCGAKINIIQ